jgi:hypothetical protein
MGLPVLRRRSDIVGRAPITELERMRVDLWSLLDTPWPPFESWPARLGASHIAAADLEETDDAFTLNSRSSCPASTSTTSRSKAVA